MKDWSEEVQQALLAPFAEGQVDFLPRATSDGMAMALPYIDARSVMSRLDAAVGPEGWSFDFEPLHPDGKMVKGRLTVLGVTKCDAGEAGAEDEPLKSAVSDALKRAAVHFGVGRYLYDLPRTWAPFDPQKRRFIEPPRLDPAAVRRAVQACGYTGEMPPARPGSAARPEQPAESRGDARAQQAVERGEARPAVPIAGGGAALVCQAAGCGVVLTKGQHDVSTRAFGLPLCPACQKKHRENLPLDAGQPGSDPARFAR